MTTVLTRGTVTIDTAVCKGCELCIPACPPDVLVMSAPDEVNELGFRYPRLLPGCTGCMACLQICPDFVFEVYKYDPPIELDVPPSEPKGPAPVQRAETPSVGEVP